VLVLAADPDEECLGASALVAEARASGLDVHLVCCTDRLPDGQVVGHESDMTRWLVDLLGDGRDTALVAPWRHDGRPDHEAAGRAAASAARRTGSQLWEYPRIVEGGAALEPVLVTRAADLPDETLERLHQRQQDPWGVESRWYERRKRQLMLSMLPRERFRHALELGCSIGALAEDLAKRCDRLLAVDSSTSALAAASRRLAGLPGTAVARLDIPYEWPESDDFDLVVVSEVGYFLSPLALEELVRRVAESMTPDGVLILCHWRHSIEGWVMDAAQVHAGFERGGLAPVQARYADRDVEILVFTHADSWLDPML
jgi:SAM-dependent methyltransferase